MEMGKIQIKDINGNVLLELERENTNLRGADLHEADLRGADLRGADLDFACLDFSCNSLHVKTDERLRVQLCFHLLSWISHADGNATGQEKAILGFCRDYANKFHRKDVERI